MKIRTIKPDKRSGPDHQRDGIVLVASMIMLGLLTVLIASLVTLTKPELAGAAYQRREREAFYEAEAGVRYIVSQINLDIKDGSLTMTGGTETVDYTAPTGYQFEAVSHILELPDAESSMFVVTAVCQNTKAVIEATVQRPQLLASAGLFGDEDLTIQPHGEIYSYDSRTTPRPTAADSTGEANIGSNEGITLKPHLTLDGEVLLGADESGISPTPPAGVPSRPVGRVNPDPLGVNGGFLADCFAYYEIAENNDNTSCASIVDNVLSTSPKETITLTAGNYYLEELYVAPKGTVVIDSTDGPVVIYLDGPLRVQPNSDFNVDTGIPGDFFIFSCSDEDIRFQPHDGFACFLYAPNADILFQPNNDDIYGVFWGNTVRLQPHGDVFIDVSLLDRFRSSQVVLTQWRRLM
jgi:hypothetical protein